MNCHRIQIFILLVQIIVYCKLINASASSLQNVHLLSNRSRLPHKENISIDKHIFENIYIHLNNRMLNSHFANKSFLKGTFEEKKRHSFDAGSNKNFYIPKLLFKRDVGPLTEARGNQIKGILSNSESSDLEKNAVNVATVSKLNGSSNADSSRNMHEKNAVLDGVNKTENETKENIIVCSYSKKWDNEFMFVCKNRTSGYYLDTTDLHQNASNDFTIKVEGYEILSPDKTSIHNWYMSLVGVFNITEIFHNPNNSMHSIPIVNLNNTDNITNTNLYILKENFNCVVEEAILMISCRNVSLYSIGDYLSNETLVLHLSYSIEIKLLQPLFPHLNRLKKLTLSNNHHRYITRAFMGLENLEELDLSNNDIMALLHAFEYIPKLKALNLSNNKFRRAGVVSNAVSQLGNLQNLTLNHNVYIRRIVKNDLYGLRNCNISLFSFFNTTLQFVEMGAFEFMPHLKVLEMSVNYLDEIALANITCSLSESVEVLYFGQLLKIKTFPSEAVNCLNRTTVRDLSLWYNFFSTVPVLPNLPSLRTLRLSNCSLANIEPDAFHNVRNLEVLNLGGNNFKHFPTAISSAKNLKLLNLDYQNIYSYNSFSIPSYAFQNLTNLRQLKLSSTRVNFLSRYRLRGLINLKGAYLSQTSLQVIEDYAFETLVSLELLDLRVNGINAVSNFTFYGLKNLRGLYLTGNLVTFYSSIYPFQFTPSLSAILLHNNDITKIPRGIFENLKNLDVLTLGQNKVLPWYEEILNPNARLRLLDVSENNIDHVSRVMLKEFHQVLNYLDLSRNPFNCSKCGIREFQTFCLNTNISLELPVPMDHSYSCAYPGHFQMENLFEIDISDEICKFESRFLNALSFILVGSFMIVAILASLFCYAFRWYIRYWIFHFKTNFTDRKNSFQEKSYKYDAFIIYSSADTPWVVRYLIPALETQEPCYKLCIHQRDFQVGRQITENILEAIENSRKVILILTETFIKSEWCLYELHLAQHKMFRDTRDILILVKLKAIDKKLYTKNISYIEKTRSCFMWSDSYIRQKLFWDQLRKHLGPPTAGLNLQINSSV